MSEPLRSASREDWDRSRKNGDESNSVLEELIQTYDQNQPFISEKPEIIQPVSVQHSPLLISREGSPHKSPSKQRRDQARQEDHDQKIRQYVENEKFFLEATAYRDEVPDSPGRGDVVALFDSRGLDVNRADVMRNSKRRHIHPSFRKFLRNPDFEVTKRWAEDVRVEMR